MTIRGTNPTNEDIIGFYKNYFWIMDGVTDLFGQCLFNSVSDSAFIVKLVNELIPRYVDDSKELDVILKSVLEEVRNFLNEKYNFSSVPDYYLPTFTIVLIRSVCMGEIDYFILGDSSLIFEHTEIVTDSRLTYFNMKNKEKLTKVPDKCKRELILKKTRKLLNSPEGYWIGSIDGKGLPYGVIGHKQVTPESRIVLVTDGFSDFFLRKKC